MSKKPDCKTAMINIITAVEEEFPFDAPDAQICGDTCVGCPKKLLELVETEIQHWSYQIEINEPPNIGEVARFGKLCRNIRRSLVRNGLI